MKIKEVVKQWLTMDMNNDISWSFWMGLVLGIDFLVLILIISGLGK